MTTEIQDLKQIEEGFLFRIDDDEYFAFSNEGYYFQESGLLVAKGDEWVEVHKHFNLNT